MSSFRELIQSRKSVRTYDGNPLSAEDREKLEGYIASVSSPFQVSVDFRLLDAKANDLSSPVVVGTDVYLAAKVRRQEHFELAYGYCFEKVCLYAQSLGIGTVMLAATLSRAAFEKAMDVGVDEVLPCVSPVGYPAAKRSLRESMMRKAIKADDRLPFESLFFDENFERPLTPEQAGRFADALSMARLAPSAGNKQPTRAVLRDGRIHFYEAKTMKDSPLGDIQKVDVGIALSHFDLTTQETGLDGRFVFENPGIATPENTEYIVTFEVSA